MIVERDGEVVVAKSEVRHGVPISGDVVGLGGDGLETRHWREREEAERVEQELFELCLLKRKRERE